MVAALDEGHQPSANSSDAFWTGFHLPTGKRVTGLKANEERPAYSPEQIERIFKHPVWTGRKSTYFYNAPGDTIVRDSLYWCPTDGAVVSDVHIVALRRRLIEVRGTVYFRGADEAARYPVATDSHGRSTELQFPFVDPGCRPADLDWDIVPSPATPSIRDGDKVRPPKAREVFHRRPNDRWRELVGALEGVGPYELSLRDPVADIQIDKRRVALVPKEARIDGRMTAPLIGELRLDGLGV